MKKIYIVLLTLGLLACEDKVNVNLPEAPEALVIDAWVNNKNEPQEINVLKTQPYFDNSVPIGVSGAIVEVTSEEGTVFTFTEMEPGKYTWDPATSTETIGDELLDYTLTVVAEGQTYAATSRIKRVPPVDSIKFTFKEERNPFQPEGYYAEFVATDPVGPSDSYWIKSYKNGVLLNRPFELNIAFDAGFNEGGNIDGVVFIQPIQDAVNPLTEELDAFEPYEVGDSLYVEIHAIPNDAFTFLQQVQIQTQRDGGFDEIFAEPMENVSTNIENVSDSPNGQVVGFFSMAAVSGNGKRVSE
ncbi:DUF4249 domain-containing protein [Fulvivirga sp. RKSG066]|uniref:DUF4249 domain-containing protein n=1 Tax=Fulvivirga aurantia TaxID=2529383 RepID=UPI0012BB695D|nr:DUF4249 domain-containing protein [Fulvivirga aurantia]MTI23034.1 DUF4249 domain-containing protein [Fulvivirga aurantia]